ncbi:MAG: hypothetical protein M3524_11660 [Actinomycetota bacterium]|nr:hypothetical protein [Actinomycetota bacterium]
MSRGGAAVPWWQVVLVFVGTPLLIVGLITVVVLATTRPRVPDGVVAAARAEEQGARSEAEDEGERGSRADADDESSAEDESRPGAESTSVDMPEGVDEPAVGSPGVDGDSEADCGGENG